jgi:hypothetical protein
MNRARAVALLALMSIAFATAGCAGGGARTPTPPAAATHTLTVAGADLSLRAPLGWHLIEPPISALTYPVERLLLSSYRTRRGGNCAPDRAERDLPADGALIYLFEYRPPPRSPRTRVHLTAFPARPAHFALRPRDRGRFECWRVPSHLIRFSAAGRRFQVHVALGPHAGAARRMQVLHVLDSLQIRPRAPPSPRSRAVTAAQLEAALRKKPNSEATSAECTRATSVQRLRARRVFGPTRLALFVCDIALRRQHAEPFDVQVLGNGCFVGERQRAGQADYGCIRP